MKAPNGTELSAMANAIRALSMDAVQAANSGHPGMPMGMADVATVLWSRHMKFDPAAPGWADRDRFILSAGHGSMLIYSLLHLTGFEDMTMDEIKRFRQLGSLTAGHPEYGHTPGVEATTGPLGQGISMSVGMALAERMLNARFGDELVDHRTWVIASDGDLQEGISHEAISLAGHLKLNRLCVLWDDNDISIDGPTDLAESTPPEPPARPDLPPLPSGSERLDRTVPVVQDRTRPGWTYKVVLFTKLENARLVAESIRENGRDLGIDAMVLQKDNGPFGHVILLPGSPSGFSREELENWDWRIDEILAGRLADKFNWSGKRPFSGHFPKTFGD